MTLYEEILESAKLLSSVELLQCKTIAPRRFVLCGALRHAGSMQGQFQFGLVRSLTLTLKQTVVCFSRLDYFLELRLLLGCEYAGQLSAH